MSPVSNHCFGNQKSGTIQHEFIAIDEGLGNLLHVNERDPSRNWVVPIGKAQPRDMQLIGQHRVLIGHHNGYTEFDIVSGRTMAEFAALDGVTSVRRQPNGHTIIAGVDIAETKGVVVVELDCSQKTVRKTVFPGDYVRLIRQSASGTYLMCCNTMIKEGDCNGRYIREFPLEGFYHAWKAVRRANGNLLVSAGYGAFIVELNPNGDIVRRFGSKEQILPAVNPFFYAMFQLLPNDHVVLANWQGHGPGLGNSGIQLLEFDKDSNLVWGWSNPEMISSVQGILVLDNLDTKLMHDERNGIMEPLTSQ